MPRASEQRAQDEAFVRRCNLEALQARGVLPLRWPVPADVPPSPKRSYRSWYEYRGWDDLSQPEVWAHLAPFDLALRLIDFSPMRPQLAQRLGWISARGHTPLDPVSQFLVFGWQDANHWQHSPTYRNLAKPCYADYAWRFGFKPGQFPSEAGGRYFLTRLGVHSETAGDTITVGEDHLRETFPIQRLNELLLPVMALLLQSEVVSPAVWTEALLGLDGMLRPAASHRHCAAVTASCYAPVTPGADPPRPCPAKKAQAPPDPGQAEAPGERQTLHGCDCTTAACAQVCRRATPWDAEARFVTYHKTNRADDHGPGVEVYGYRELAIQLVDLERRTHYTLLCDYRPANDGECAPMTALLAQLPRVYAAQPGGLPVGLHVATVAGDAAFGQEPALSLIYHDLHARRVLDLRAHSSDKDKRKWPERGYDDQGRPLCEFGYAFTANGYDAATQRHKWFCAQACQHGVEPVVRLPDTQYPPPECAWQSSAHAYGQIRNIGLCFADGSTRLVRDVVPGTPAWKACYPKARNAAESHNAGVQQHDQKRMPVYGQLRGKAFTVLHNVWESLTTLARLVYEATQAARQWLTKEAVPVGPLS